MSGEQLRSSNREEEVSTIFPSDLVELLVFMNKASL